MLRVLPIITVLALSAVTPVTRASERDAFFKQHCIDCHGADVQEAGLRLDRLSRDLANPDVMRTWVLIHDRVRAGEMPPEDSTQPPASDVAEFISRLRNDLLAAERKNDTARGKDLVRRMNRTEYEHTLRDLLSLPLLRVREMLPEDGRRHGFDKVPSALELSHIQMSKYLQAADLALRQAIVRSPTRPETQTWRGLAAEQGTGRAGIAIHAIAPVRDGKLAPELTSVVRGNPVEDPGNTYRSAVFNGKADSAVVLSGKFGAHQPQGLQPDRFRVTTGGWYRVRFSVWGLRWNQGKIEPAVRSVIRHYTEYHGWRNPEFWKRDERQRWVGKPLAERQVRETEENTAFYGDAEVVHVVRASLKGKVIGFFDAPSRKPTEHEFRVWLEPGEKVSFHVMTLPGTGPRNTAAANGVRSYEGPGVAFDWFEIEGPVLDSWPPESQQRLFGKTPIGAFPRPPLPGVPTVSPDQPLHLSAADSLSGVGKKLGNVWYLNIEGAASTKVNLAEPGRYELAVTTSETAAGDEDSLMRLLIDDVPLAHGQFAVRATRDQPKTFRRTFAAPSAGPVEIGIEFLNDFFDEKTKADRNLLIHEIVITPKPSKEEHKLPKTPDVRTLLLEFANRAFRRPVSLTEMEPYAKIVTEQLSAGQSFEESMIAGYKALLCAPDFLFLGLEDGASMTDFQVRRKQHGSAALEGHRAEFALASRLSYFLWNSLPDDRLRKLAASGKLSQPKTLLGEIDRMLKDLRSDRFVEHFLDQWLELRDIDFTTPDRQLYPEFDPWLRDSMLAETRAYFRKLIDENRGVDHVVDSEFVLINQRLAELYDIRGVAGGQLQEVKLTSESPRGGLLTQAAILKVTANGTATSPVLRGAWVTERILGIPIKPPPPNIPAVEPDASGAVTIREQIERHRADPACASCHKVMDPPGLALESFDVIGGWRDRYRASGRPQKIKVPGQKQKVLEPTIEVLGSRGRKVTIRLGGQVDPSGVLPDGRAFDNLQSLKQLLLEQREQLARNVAQKLAIYATGRGHRFSDREIIDSIVSGARQSDYGIRTLIERVVLSRLFIQQD